MVNGTAVSVGLDVHKASIRLAAVRADELLDERTLPYDVEAVERVVLRWPGARVCYEAGPGIRAVPPLGRARDRVRGRGAGVDPDQAGGADQDRPARRAQARQVARRRPV